MTRIWIKDEEDWTLTKLHNSVIRNLYAAIVCVENDITQVDDTAYGVEELQASAKALVKEARAMLKFIELNKREEPKPGGGPPKLTWL